MCCLLNSSSVHYRNYNFHETHVEVPRLIAATANSLGITNLIHVSALNADHNSPSKFLKSKVGKYIDLNKFTYSSLIPFRLKVKKLCVMLVHQLS